MAILHVTSQDFEEKVLHSDIPVLVDFWAPWCGPCRMLAPTLEEIADENEGKVAVAKVNIDDEMDLAARFGIASIPTMILFDKGTMAARSVGLQPKASIEKMWK